MSAPRQHRGPRRAKRARPAVVSPGGVCFWVIVVSASDPFDIIQKGDAWIFYENHPFGCPATAAE